MAAPAPPRRSVTHLRYLLRLIHAAPWECWAFGGRVSDSGGGVFPVSLVIRLMFLLPFIGPNRIKEKR